MAGYSALSKESIVCAGLSGNMVIDQKAGHSQPGVCQCRYLQRILQALCKLAQSNNAIQS